MILFLIIAIVASIGNIYYNETADTPQQRDKGAPFGVVATGAWLVVIGGVFL